MEKSINRHRQAHPGIEFDGIGETGSANTLPELTFILSTLAVPDAP